MTTNLPIDARIGHGIAHAKVILIGEHAVVYGQPAIAMPLPALKVEAILRQTTAGQTIDSPPYQGDLSRVGDNFEGLRQLLLQLLAHFNAPNLPFHLEVVTNIPEERGLGSSAAFATAITKAFFDYFDAPLQQDDLLYFANLEENITHGKSSGIDVATVSADGPLWYVKNAQLTAFPMNIQPAALVIADTGIHGQTIRAISVIQEQMARTPDRTQAHIQQLGHLTHTAREALSNHHLRDLGAALNDAQTILQTLGVSHPQLDHLVNAARQAGALGAKLTGGGIGGAMIALAKNNDDAIHIANALLAAGARDAWITEF